MKREIRKVTQSTIDVATHYSQKTCDNFITMALRLATDADATMRRQDSLCKACYYRNPKIAGQIRVTQPCGICEENQLYNNANTDMMCQKCASIHNLCKHCGADVNFTSRSNFKHIRK